MRIKQFKDVLKELADAHESIANLCNELGMQTQDDRLRLLLADIEKKQREAQQHILNYILQAPCSVLINWVEFAFEQPFADMCRQVSLSPAVNVNDVLFKVGQLEQVLVDNLSMIAQEAPSEECRVVYQDLVIAESNRAKAIVHSCHRAEDI